MNPKYEKKKLFPAIHQYNKATRDLAKIMSDIKNTNGRKFLEDTTLFDVSFINSMCRYGNFPLAVPPYVSLQHYNEFCGESRNSQKKILSDIIKRNLKPSHLRKMLREMNKTVNTVDSSIKTNSWQKNLILLENDLRKMNSETRARALSFVTNSILK